MSGATYTVRAVWEARPAQLAVTDKITVRNLQVNVNAGVDVWGRKKAQRALITVVLALAKPFDSAAEADALDNSTVHYGKLSKSIQACIQEGTPEEGANTFSSSSELVNSIVQAARTTAGNAPLASVEVDVFYPKGSMLGDGAGWAIGLDGKPWEKERYRQLYLRNVRVPCLIGVNANERLQKQPVVVNLWIERTHRCDGYQQLETILIDAISASSFETLESLTTTVVQQLREKFFTDDIDQDSFIRLQIEKPHAVPAADAPVIEIFRPVRV